MNNSDKGITGILLAGGMSKRMGREKGKLMIGDKYLYKYPLEVLEDICDEILISTCKNFNPVWEYPAVCDELENIGPIGGIFTCLKESRSELNVVLSYDMPRVNKELLEYLLNQVEDNQMVVPALIPERPEPLCAIYRKEMSEVFKHLIDQKIYAVNKAISHSRSKTVVISEEMPFYKEDIFLNINSEGDLDKLTSIRR